MSVLNQASDGQFNILQSLTRAVIRFGPMPRDDLLRLCGSEIAALTSGRLTPTLKRWLELGLLEETEAGIGVGEPYRRRLGKDPDAAEPHLVSCVREAVLAAKNNDRFWEAGENRSADFTRGAAWLLAQDVYHLDAGSFAKISPLELSQLNDRETLIIRNDTRWTGLRAWMAYLGFAEESASFAVDPTRALAGALSAIFEDGDELPAPLFVSRAAQTLPVLDGGVYRVKVEAALKDGAWPRPQEGWVSTSLSRAIQRLILEGSIGAEHLSDSAEGVTLTGLDQRGWRRITHIRRGRA